jgi:hypothetical protein
MPEPTHSKVRKIIAYILAGLILIFAVVAILAIWDIIDYDNLVARMFQSLMVLLAASAVIVLILSILDRSSDGHEPRE